MKPSHQEIRDTAYQLYCERDGASGSAEQDWLQAERQLMGASAEVLAAPEHNAPIVKTQHLSHHERNLH